MAADGGSSIERRGKRFVRLLEEANGSLVSDFWRCQEDKRRILLDRRGGR
jgi:hypothetical protein